jgi:hypothetical protein
MGDLNVPHAGPVEERILRFLYDNRGHGFRTNVIAYKIDDRREHVYNSLQALYKRGYVRKRWSKKYGNERVWYLNPNREIIKKVERKLQIPISRRIVPEQEATRQLIQIGRPLLEVGLQALAYSTPLAREFYFTYKIVDIVYSSWNLIEKYQVTYQKEGMSGIRKAAGYDATKEFVGTVETNIVWYAIQDKIKPDDRETSKDVLSTFMDNITDKEIGYVKQFLEQTF